MKISMFKGGRALKFVQGVLEKVRDNNKIEGEFEFYQLSKDKIDRIAKLKEEIKDEDEMLYKTIPIISDFDMDITLDEFKEMLQFPTKQFMEVINEVIDITKEMLESSNTMVELKDKIENVKSELPVVEKVKEPIVQEPIKTNEEILEELYSQLSLPKIKSDKEKRMDILDKINKFEMSA